MSEAETARRFDAFRARGDAATLLDAALLVAHCDRRLDEAAVEARLAALAEGARGYVDAHRHAFVQAEGLCCFLKDVEGFHGDPEHYHERDNSRIDRVLETRRGLPISLAVLYVEIGRRLGLACEGVNFPGHFLVRMRAPTADDGNPDVLIDPFAGRPVGARECAELLRATQGPEARLDPAQLAAATPLQVLVRMLNNLKQLALSEGALEEALRMSRRIQFAEPDLVVEHRDRALVLEKLARPEEAVAELQALLAVVDGEAAEWTRDRIEALRTGRVVH